MSVEATTKVRDEMDWSAYATQYDLMCDSNPEYESNLSQLLSEIPHWDLPSAPTICDIGAGTGNYICGLHNHLPDAQFVHIDSNTEMNRIARAKYEHAGLRDVTVVEDMIQRVSFPPESFDLVLCVHSLYSMPPQQIVLRKVRRWLRPSGLLFVIDLGRVQDVRDWGLYLLKETVRRHGLFEYIRRLVKGREVVKQNRLTARGQASGRYWLHSTSEFVQTLEAADLEVVKAHTCYRGYSDLAICRPARTPALVTAQIN